MAQIDDQLIVLGQDVTALTTVVASATALLNGIGQMITDAVAAALALGATPAQLSALTDVDTAINSQTASLAAAVAANTPPVVTPTPVPDPVPTPDPGTP